MAGNNMQDLIVRIIATTEGEERVAALVKMFQSMGVETGKAESMARALAGGVLDVQQAAEKSLGPLGGMSKEFGLILKYAVAYKAVNVFAEAIFDIPKLADAYKNLRGRLEIVVEGEEALAQALAQVHDIANASGAELNATGALYQRLAQNADKLGLSMGEIADLVDTVNKSFVVSGSTVAEAAGSTRQLIQAISSAVLRGDEMNSVFENSPRILEALSVALKKDTGELRKMAEEGELTARRVLAALLNQKEVIEAEFAKMPNTIGRAAQRVANDWQVFIGKLDETSGASDAVAGMLDNLAKHIDDVAHVALISGEAMLAGLVVKAGGALIEYGKRLSDTVAQTYAKIDADKLLRASALDAAQGEEIAAKAALDAARAKAAATAATLAEAEANVVNAREMAIYGTMRANIERHMATAKLANVAATEAIIAAERQYQAASAASAAAQASVARGVGAMSAAMALLGGPAGAVTLAVFALLAFTQSQVKASESTAELNVQLDAQVKKLNELSQGQLRKYIDDLGLQIRVEEQAVKVAQARVESMDRQVGGYGDLAEWNRRYNAAQAEEETATAKLDQRRRELANATQRMTVLQAELNQKLQEGTETTQASVKAAEGAEKAIKAENKVIEMGIRARLEEAKSEQSMAEAKGLSATATIAKNKVAEIEVELAKQKAASSIQEAEADIVTAQEKYKLALVKKENVEAAQEELTASARNYEAAVLEADIAVKVAQAKAEETRQKERAKEISDRLTATIKAEGEAIERAGHYMDDLSGGIGSMASTINGAIETMHRLGGNTASVINTARQAVQQATNGNVAAMKQLESAIDSNALSFQAYYFGIWEAQKKAIAGYQAEKDALDAMVRGLQDGTVNADAAQFSFQMLGDEELVPLRQAISDAQARMRSLEADAQSTLNSMRDELDQLQGDYDEIERRRAKIREAEILAQIAEAKASGNISAVGDLQKALDILKEVSRLRIEDARQREREERSRSGTTTYTDTGDRTGGVANFAPTINLNGGLLGTPEDVARTLLPEIERIYRLRS